MKKSSILILCLWVANVSIISCAVVQSYAKGPIYSGHEVSIVRDMKTNAEEHHQWMKDAIIEYRLWDASRVDIYTDEYAVEVDWAKKWAEAVGQTSYYADVTGKKPGIVLLVKDKKKDEKYIYRCQTVCVKRSIKLWLVYTKPIEVEVDP